MMMAAPQHRTRRAQRQRLAWVSILGLGLAACAPSVGPNASLGWIEAGSPKKLEVERAEYRHSVYFATDRAEISALERDRLLAFLESVQPGGRDDIRIEGHADERATDLYNVELASHRIQSVADFLRQEGLGDLTTTSSAYGESVPAVEGSGPKAWRANRRAEVIVERYVVTPPACPDWSRASGTDFANLPHSNQGCATETNLGLMIAEPKDLVRGRGLAPADGTQAAEAIVRYRTGKVTPLLEEEVSN
ncbi:MAG: CpaD family pilus assembly lipoprotein [Geminicoccaceae bacterium]